MSIQHPGRGSVGLSKKIFPVLASHGYFLDQQGDANVQFGQVN